MVLVKSFLTWALYACFKLIYVDFNEWGKVRKYCTCLKLMIQAHLHVGFFKIFFIKHVSLSLLITNVPYHVETSQLIRNATQLPGFYMMRKICRYGLSNPINILNCCNQSQFFNCLVIKIFPWSFLQRSVQNVPTNALRGFHVETTWKQPFPRRFNAESTWCVCRDILATICIVRKKQVQIPCNKMIKCNNIFIIMLSVFIIICSLKSQLISGKLTIFVPITLIASEIC